MVLDYLIESFQNFTIHYKESLAFRAQKYGLAISSLLLALIPFSAYPPIIVDYQINLITLSILSYGVSICIPFVTYLLYYMWKSVIIYNLKCWKLNDTRRQEFRELSIRRYSDTILKLSAKFPFGASNWKITLKHPPELDLEPYTTVSGTLVFNQGSDFISVLCRRSDYHSFSLSFRISCDVNISLENIHISFLCEKNSSNEKIVKKVSFFVDP